MKTKQFTLSLLATSCLFTTFNSVAQAQNSSVIPPQAYQALGEMMSRAQEQEMIYLRAGFVGDISKFEKLDPQSLSAEYLLAGAACGGHADLVLILLNKGVSSRAAMFSASLAGNMEIVQLLIYNRAGLQYGIRGAALGGHREIVQLLLEKGAKPNKGIYEAAFNGHTDIVLLLIEKGADPTGALAGAAEGGQVELVKLMLEKGADPGAAMPYASKGGHADIVKLLIQKQEGDSKVHDESARAQKALDEMITYLKNNDEAIACLRAGFAGDISKFEKLDPQSLSAEYLLAGTACGGHADLVLVLLNKGVSPRAAMFGSALGGRLALVELLLEKGADPNEGLEVAAVKGNVEIVKLLLSQPGIKVNAIDHRGKTPLDYAIEHKHTDCAELIRAAGGKRSSELAD